MEKGKIWDAPEESREEDKDTAPPGEDVRRGGGIQAQCSHENMEQESSPHDVNELHMEPLMLVVREMQSELTVAKLQHNEPRAGGNSAGGRLERTEPGSGGHGHTERNGERHNQDMEDGRLITTETIGKEPDMGDYVGVTKKAVRRPFVCDGSKDSQCVESFLLQRDLRTRLFDHSELEGNVEVVENEDLAEESGDDHPNQYKAGRSYEKSPDSSCLAASCSIADYPYVDFSTNEFIVMCDFAAAEDTQLTLTQGDKVCLLDAVTAEWWWVEHNDRCGYVPATHLRAVHDEEDSDIDDPWQDEEYYGSYKTLKLHLEMLSDQPRTETYRNVIIQNSMALKGKRILDLGCGTGIISCFCAQLAEPEIVYAVEASEIAEQTAKLVDENGYSNIIQVQGHRAEELQLPTKVDVLVSEWMGTCLLFEFMLESVLLARDLWLEEDGVMWPSSARVHLVPCSADKEYEARVLFWDSPYGLDFSVLKPIAIQEFFSRPKPDYVLKPEDCLSQPCTLLDVNMKTLSVEDLESMSGEFHFHVDRDGTFHGFTAWFSVQFKNIDNQEQVELDTGPFKKLTHWKHTLFMLDKPLHIYSGDRIAGSAVFKRNPIWRRHLSVTITWTITSSSRTVQVSTVLQGSDVGSSIHY
ncbi:protein arginine N-methyltransferase 2 isoform X2 [Dendrobates tinctorius]|uniref:protein arginine N-methyltransferase 2 isoform X2 n=1 Tax=Dendrobates tinctorius TaxID=92724 RepID=UPI003CC9D3F5